MDATPQVDALKIALSNQPVLLGTLDLTPGSKTIRKVQCCPFCTHTEIDGSQRPEPATYDAWIKYDEDRQTYVLSETYGDRPVCNSCDNDTVPTDYTVYNIIAIKYAFQSTLEDIKLIKSLPLDYIEKKRCSECGTEEIQWDGYAKYDPFTNSYNDPTNFDRNPDCDECDKEVDPEEKVLTGHESVISLQGRGYVVEHQKRKLAKALEWLQKHQDIFEVDDATLKVIEDITAQAHA